LIRSGLEHGASSWPSTPHSATQVTAEQLEGLRALANEPRLTWTIASWKLAGFRALLARQESAEALVSTLAARFATHPELLKLALTTDSGAVGSLRPARARTDTRALALAETRTRTDPHTHRSAHA
jgi:hypothetical protein